MQFSLVLSMRMQLRNFHFSYALTKHMKRCLTEAKHVKKTHPLSFLLPVPTRVAFTCHVPQRRFSTKTAANQKSRSPVVGEKHEKLSISEIQSTLKSRLSYVYDKSVANKLAVSVIGNRVNPTAPILEIAPGIGLVSREFLHQGVEKVIALETKTVFHPYLQSVQDDHDDCKFEFDAWNMLNLHQKFYDNAPVDSTHSYRTKEAEIVKKLSRPTFTETEAPYSVFTVGGSQENQRFVLYILRNLPQEDPILWNERVEFFFLVHPKFKLCIEEILPTHRPSNYNSFYNYFHTFISLLYDVTFLEEFEANDFVPSFPKRSKRIDASKRHLVRMRLKPYVSDILPLDHHHAFSLFLRNIFRKRHSRIIPAMEMLVAGAGLHMLSDGFTMMETIVDVSPDRLLQLYKSMVQWPEYSVSHLKNYLEMKTQGGSMEDENM